MSKTKPVIASADIYWANLEKKNEMSGKYQVDLCNLSETAVNALEEMGITLKSNPKKPEMGQYITCTSLHNIRAYNTSGDELSGHQIGNGSKARAVVSFYDWTFKGKKGRSPSIERLVIDDLIVYDSTEGGESVAYDLAEAI
tara:strand:- start:6757 stop:7182 length:426 start_codon:yes stop_codon:yes gene_type:complete